MPRRGFEWDPAKSAENLRQRGFDFEFAANIFDGPTVEREDRRQDYGERRMLAIGCGRHPSDDRLHRPPHDGRHGASDHLSPQEQTPGARTL
jgi:hypothetical protein